MRLVPILLAVGLAAPLLAAPAPLAAGPWQGPLHGPLHGEIPAYDQGYEPARDFADGFYFRFGNDPRPRYRRGPATCVAVAFRGYGEGQRIRGTRGIGQARFTRRACRRAIRECYDRLRYAPAGPRARCVVVRSS